MELSFDEIRTTLSPEAAAAWEILVGHIREHYRMDELWDGKDELKFRRSGKTLLTLYLRQEYFTVLLIYGKAERDAFEAAADAFPPVLRELYENSRTYHDGKWMWLDVRDDRVVPDLIRMLGIKKKPEKPKISPVDEFLPQIPTEYTSLFRALADHAISLGYRPVRCKTATLNIDFRSSKAKRTIMKFTLEEEGHDSFAYGERKLPGLRMRFFASTEYSGIFHKAVQYVIERFDGKYTGCYGCGRCQGEPQGYHYTYPDGRQVFRCGGELLSVFDFTDANLDEMKALLTRQAEYDYAQIGK
ncbi:MAG: DUF3788 family protein [Clostridia bacterium]|nr:DUF3788 family protein [Clostridia bacterium]